MVQNKGLIFKAVPSSLPEAGKHIAVESRDFDLEQAPPTGGFTAKVHYASFDPAQRGRMRSQETKSYSPADVIGKPITTYAILSIIKSDHESFRSGNLVYAPRAYMEEYNALEKNLADRCSVISNPYKLDTKLFVGALGMTGLTAYSSYYEIGQPKEGETILISAASGAVGQLVGQLARRDGLAVIGSVGDDKKLDYITKSLGFDGGFNYKKEKPVEALKRLAPSGIDIYYENVGGEKLEAALEQMNNFGRIVACGMVSQYNKPPNEAYGVRNLFNIVSKRLKMQGFIFLDENMGPKYTEEHQKNVQKWIHDGSIKVSQSVTYGIDNSAEGLIGLFEGKNFGKAILEVSPL